MRILTAKVDTVWSANLNVKGANVATFIKLINFVPITNQYEVQSTKHVIADAINYAIKELGWLLDDIEKIA